MIASVGFKKQLWSLDPELDVIWDYISERWEIWRFPGQKEKKQKVWDERSHHVMTVKTRDGSFRELGADILLRLQAGDTHKYTLDQLVAYFDQLDKNVVRANERRVRNVVESLNRDMISFAYGHKVQVPRSYIIDVPKETRAKRVLGG